MKKYFYLSTPIAVLAVVSARCNRFPLKTDHNPPMADIKETTSDENWEDEPLLEIPDIPGEAGGHPDASGAERMFREGY